MKIKIIVLSLIATTIMSCNTNKKKDTDKTNVEMKSEMAMESIENTKWVITKFEGADMSDEENNGQEIFFTLDSKTNRVHGNSGCNTFNGTYKIEEGNRISFSKLASTRMMCPDLKINESEILKVFATADNFTISDGKISLNKAKMAPLAEFKEVPMFDNAIVGKYWKLKTLEGKEVKMVNNQEREISFTLRNEGKFDGFAGCNTFSGEYTLEEGNRIRFSKVATTLKACPDVDVNESELLKVFELADNFTIQDDVLSLNVGRRAPLAVFEAVYLK